MSQWEDRQRDWDAWHVWAACIVVFNVAIEYVSVLDRVGMDPRSQLFQHEQLFYTSGSISLSFPRVYCVLDISKIQLHLPSNWLRVSSRHPRPVLILYDVIRSSEAMRSVRPPQCYMLNYFEFELNNWWLRLRIIHFEVCYSHLVWIEVILIKFDLQRGGTSVLTAAVSQMDRLLSSSVYLESFWWLVDHKHLLIFHFLVCMCYQFGTDGVCYLAFWFFRNCIISPDDRWRKRSWESEFKWDSIVSRHE